MQVITKSCSCKHDYQDYKYGNHNRLMNVSMSGTKATCTVCGKEHSVKKG